MGINSCKRERDLASLANLPSQFSLHVPLLSPTFTLPFPPTVFHVCLSALPSFVPLPPSPCLSSSLPPSLPILRWQNWILPLSGRTRKAVSSMSL